MGRHKGSLNKGDTTDVFALTDQQRLELIARLLLEIICEDSNESAES